MKLFSQSHFDTAIFLSNMYEILPKICTRGSNGKRLALTKEVSEYV